jgi:hypothetical protein
MHILLHVNNLGVTGSEMLIRNIILTIRASIIRIVRLNGKSQIAWCLCSTFEEYL